MKSNEELLVRSVIHLILACCMVCGKTTYIAKQGTNGEEMLTKHVENTVRIWQLKVLTLPR